MRRDTFPNSSCDTVFDIAVLLFFYRRAAGGQSKEQAPGPTTRDRGVRQVKNHADPGAGVAGRAGLISGSVFTESEGRHSDK